MKRLSITSEETAKKSGNTLVMQKHYTCQKQDTMTTATVTTTTTNNNKIKILHFPLKLTKITSKQKVILIHMCKSLCRGSLQLKNDVSCEGHVNPWPPSPSNYCLVHFQEILYWRYLKKKLLKIGAVKGIFFTQFE